MMKKRPAACTIAAPCKINLHLRIGEKMLDGFHSLESLIAPLSLHDTLDFELAGEEGDCFLETKWETAGEAIPNEKNLVIQAVSLFREKTGFSGGLRIVLHKRIPAGAGLGGGSSDAASSLLALNCLSGASLSKRELREMGAILGSDVPFFLGKGAAFASGRGEKLKPVKMPKGLWVLLIKPAFSSNTGKAFHLLDEARESAAREGKPAAARKTPHLIRALKGEIDVWPFYNDFQPLFLGSYPLQNTELEANAAAYQRIFTSLMEQGACFSSLSGSGSCCFGLFKEKGMAEKAEKTLKNKGNFVNLSFFLANTTKPVVK